MNESSGSSGKQNNNFGIRYSNNKMGYGYGPNEFLASASNQPCSDGIGTAYAFSAQIKCNISYVKDNSSLPHEYNCFNITKDNLKLLSEPYYFIIGYNPTFRYNDDFPCINWFPYSKLGSRINST